MEVIISVIENQPGETIERHIHHGEEAFYVLQGARHSKPRMASRSHCRQARAPLIAATFRTPD